MSGRSSELSSAAR